MEIFQVNGQSIQIHKSIIQFEKEMWKIEVAGKCKDENYRVIGGLNVKYSTITEFSGTRHIRKSTWDAGQERLSVLTGREYAFDQVDIEFDEYNQQMLPMYLLGIYRNIDGEVVKVKIKTALKQNYTNSV